jgi:hypothetical protein
VLHLSTYTNIISNRSLWQCNVTLHTYTNLTLHHYDCFNTTDSKLVALHRRCRRHRRRRRAVHVVAQCNITLCTHESHFTSLRMLTLHAYTHLTLNRSLRIVNTADSCWLRCIVDAGVTAAVDVQCMVLQDVLYVVQRQVTPFRVAPARVHKSHFKACVMQCTTTDCCRALRRPTCLPSAFSSECCAMQHYTVRAHKYHFTLLRIVNTTDCCRALRRPTCLLFALHSGNNHY